MNHAQVELQGYILHFDSASTLSASWKKRWAVLSNFCLYLYKEQDEKYSIFELLLPSTKIVHSRVHAGERAFTIKIEDGNGQSTFLATENVREFEIWYNTLSAAALLKRLPRKEIDELMDANGYYQFENSYSHHDAAGDPNPLLYERPNLNNLSISQRHLHQNDKVEVQQSRRDDTMPSLSVQNSALSYSESNRELPITKHKAVAVDMHAFQHRNMPTEANYAADQRRFADVSGVSRGGQQLQYPRQHVIETVKEDPGMSDSMILATRPIEDIRRQFPVSGLAKRMSIAASDLLGKSHDELIILLIQLNREKSNLDRLNDYYHLILQRQLEEASRSTNEQQHYDAQERINKTRKEIADVEIQLDLSQPLITFIDNIVKMGSLFGGDDLMFATEYRAHLLQPHEIRPLRDNVNFMRKMQERDVSNEMSHGDHQRDSSVYDLPHESFQMAPESTEFVKTRQQLENELKDLEKVYVNYHSRKKELSDYMNQVQKSGLRANHSSNEVNLMNGKDKVGRGTHSYLETDLDLQRQVDLAAKFPRRMDSHASDPHTPARRPHSNSETRGRTTLQQFSVNRHPLSSVAASDDVFVSPIAAADMKNGGRSSILRAPKLHHPQHSPNPSLARSSMGSRSAQSSVQNQLNLLINGDSIPPTESASSTLQPYPSMSKNESRNVFGSTTSSNLDSMRRSQESSLHPMKRADSYGTRDNRLSKSVTELRYLSPAGPKNMDVARNMPDSRDSLQRRFEKDGASLDTRQQSPHRSENVKRLSVDEFLLDKDAIDNAIFVPEKVSIPQRYSPTNSELDAAESRRFLSPEEQRRKAERLDNIRRIVARHSLQQWNQSEIGVQQVRQEDVNLEHQRREMHLLVRQNLGVQAAEQAKLNALNRRRTRELENNDINPQFR